MKYLEGKSKIDSGEQFTVEEIKRWINEASKQYSFFDVYFRGKNKLKKLLIKNFERIVEGLSFDDKYRLLIYNSIDIPELKFKANELILKILDEQLRENSELIDTACLIKCFEIAYPDDKNRKLDESEEKIKEYLETNFDRVIDKILIDDYYELMYSLKNVSKLDEFLRLFRQNYENFLEKIKKFGMHGISDFNVTNDQLYGVLSEKFKYFFDKLHERDDFEEFVLKGNFFKTIDEHEDLKKEVIEVVEEAFQKKELQMKDFKWLTSLLKRYDSKYLFENVFELFKLLPAREINTYLNILENNPNFEESIKVLEKEAYYFIEKTYTPIATMKAISNARKALEKKRHVEIDIDELKNIASKREKEIVIEMTNGRIDSKDGIELIMMLINDIANDEECYICDTELLGRGSYSTVYRIGNKVLKLGTNLYQFEISKNHRRFMQALVRKKLNLGRKTVIVLILLM